MSRLILGIDPGSRLTGWGLVRPGGGQSAYVASGTLKLGEKLPLAERLVALDAGLAQVIGQYRPTEAAVEKIFHAKNAASALTLGHARGVALLAAAKQGLPLFEYTASQVKQTVTGQGRADKSQVQRMIQLMLGVHRPMGEDESDALAIALTHAAAHRAPPT